VRADDQAEFSTADAAEFFSAVWHDAIRRIRSGADPLLARVFWKVVVKDLRKDSPLDRAVSRLVAEAIEFALSRPEAKAGRAFGLIRPASRPARDWRRDRQIAIEVFRLRSEGIALRGERGAFARVAVRRRTSVKTVQRIWARHRQSVSAAAAFEDRLQELARQRRPGGQ
jgi:hypothetical protein